MHPDYLPPNRDCGGPAGLTELSKRVKALGYLFGLHDQYIDFYHDAPSFDEKKSIILDNGRPARVNMWAGGPCDHLCYHFIPGFVRRNIFEGIRRPYPMYHNSPSVWAMAQPTAYYLDCFGRTVECWSKEHPMTRTQARLRQNEACRITREGKDGQGVVLSVEHPRDWMVPYVDFGWSIGHFSADVVTTAGESQYQPVGIPVPLWHLVFHDAVCLPNPDGNELESMLYAQAPYFWLSKGKMPAPKELAAKKAVLALHEDAAFSEMTGHKLLSADGSVQKCIYGGIEVEVDKKKCVYKVSGGKAKTNGWKKL